jgi:glycosyltransferase involved in cell wall biosynthesis
MWLATIQYVDIRRSICGQPHFWSFLENFLDMVFPDPSTDMGFEILWIRKTMFKMNRLIIQIPCFNEAETLPSVVRDLPREVTGIDQVEILVVDDGSRDGTSQVAKRLGVDCVVRHRTNRGLAAAFDSGLRESIKRNATIIVNTDGDHQYPGKHIEQLVQPILDGSADVVIGDRRPEMDKRNSWTKRLLYRWGRWVVSWIVSRPIPDPVSGFRAYSAECARQMVIQTNYSYTIESLVQCIEKGFAVEFVPIETNAPTRPSRLYRTKASFILRSGITLLRVFFMFHPLKTLTWLSGLLAVIGLIPIVRFVGFYLMGNGTGHLQSLVLGASLLVLSAILFVAGLLADLISQNRRLLERIRASEFEHRSKVGERRRLLRRTRPYSNKQ